MATHKAGIPAQLFLAGLVGIEVISALLASGTTVDTAAAQDVDTNKETPTPSPKPAPGGALMLPGEGNQPELPPKAILDHEPLAPALAKPESGAADAALPTLRLESEQPGHDASQDELVQPPEPSVPLEPRSPPSRGGSGEGAPRPPAH